MQQFFISDPILLDSQIKLNDSITYQCLTVLRYTNDTKIILVNDDSIKAIALLIIKGKELFAKIDQIILNDLVTKTKVILIQALIRKEKFEWVLQKATECGVDTIIPLILERNVVKWTQDESKIVRWQKIVQEAAEQSKRNTIPKVLAPIELNDIDQFKSELNVFAYEKEDQLLLKNALSSVDSVSIVVGCEGGFASKESNALIDKGFIPVSLGNRIYRAETATIVALTVIDTVLGI